MSDFASAEGQPEGNSGFADEWQRLAREDTGVPAGPEGEARHETALEAKPNGQSGDAAPPSEAAPREPAPGTNTNDIWAEAPAHLREAYEAAEAAREKAENAVRSNNGRASKAERDAAALRAQLLARPSGQAPARQPEAQQPDPALRAKLVGDYEEIAPVVDELLELRQTVARLEASSASSADAQAARHELELAEFLQGEEAKLNEAHSDWGTVVREPAFVEWVQEGPQFIRQGIARNAEGIVDGAEAAAIIDLFKQQTGRAAADDPQAARRRRQLEGARAVPARSPGATVAGPPDDYSAEWKRLAALDAAQAVRR